MNIEELKLKLLPAVKHIELLCEGFSVKVCPPYKEVLDRVCKQVENSVTNVKEVNRILFILKQSEGSLVVGVEGSILRQFKEKFLEILKREMIPEIKKFCKANPEIDIKSFRELFEIKIEKS
jgi:hypothetical protein